MVLLTAITVLSIAITALLTAITALLIAIAAAWGAAAAAAAASAGVENACDVADGRARLRRTLSESSLSESLRRPLSE